MKKRVRKGEGGEGGTASTTIDVLLPLNVHIKRIQAIWLPQPSCSQNVCDSTFLSIKSGEVLICMEKITCKVKQVCIASLSENFSSGDMFNTPVSLFSHDKFRIAITMIRGCKFDLIANTFGKPNTKGT